jgi:hypothetical protein
MQRLDASGELRVNRLAQFTRGQLGDVGTHPVLQRSIAAEHALHECLVDFFELQDAAEQALPGVVDGECGSVLVEDRCRIANYVRGFGQVDGFEELGQLRNAVVAPGVVEELFEAAIGHVDRHSRPRTNGRVIGAQLSATILRDMRGDGVRDSG